MTDEDEKLQLYQREVEWFDPQVYEFQEAFNTFISHVERTAKERTGYVQLQKLKEHYRHSVNEVDAYEEKLQEAHWEISQLKVRNAELESRLKEASKTLMHVFNVCQQGVTLEKASL